MLGEFEADFIMSHLTTILKHFEEREPRDHVFITPNFLPLIQKFYVNLLLVYFYVLRRMAFIFESCKTKTSVAKGINFSSLIRWVSRDLR